MIHYTKTSRAAKLRAFPFLVCEACYRGFSQADQTVYTVCRRDCGTLAGCERCQDEAEQSAS